MVPGNNPTGLGLHGKPPLTLTNSSKLLQLTDELARTVGTVRLLISTSKTKFMNMNTEEGTFEINGEDLDNVEELTYLGSKTLTDGKITMEVRTRTTKAAVTFNSLNIWK